MIAQGAGTEDLVHGRSQNADGIQPTLNLLPFQPLGAIECDHTFESDFTVMCYRYRIQLGRILSVG